MSANIHAVTFDLWETLMHNVPDEVGRRDEERARLMHLALQRAGKTLSIEDVQTALKDIWQWLETSYWDRDVDPGFDA
ncbi:MAG TPA: hypothetical protein VKU60_17060, partial [Chloroflexota bacterium]|nr:hypothetical protein [Chloroflexota bacterium]